MKLQIGRRLREKREQSGYTREKMGSLCSLSPRFIANVELGDSTLSLDSLITVCRVLSCSSDSLIFGGSVDAEAWAGPVSKLRQLDTKYLEPVNKVLQGMLEIIRQSEL